MTSFNFQYTLANKHQRARYGTLKTPHGSLETPAFIFCATKAAIKGLSPFEMKQEKTQIILSNTYHLMLQPGADIVEKMGGLHKFMKWDGPMLTDSGGFQIFSLGHGSVANEIKGRRLPTHSATHRKTLMKIREEGATFKSYIDGKTHLLTPEKSIEVQRKLGADLIVVLDECTPFNVDRTYTRESMEMSHRWALRSHMEFNRKDNGTQGLYGITQGGIYPDLRQESCEFINSHPFFGHAIGGSLGCEKEQMYEVIDICTSHLRPDRPIHLLGIGGVKDIFNGVKHGVDTFDCVHPTRLARHGGALVRPENRDNETTHKEHINLRNARYKDDPKPIEDDCDCQTCTHFSRAYIHHLLKAKELLAFSLITRHNVNYMNRLLTAIRRALRNDTLAEEEKNWVG
jgi:queuine tRNA-ribosyltransferase